MAATKDQVAETTTETAPPVARKRRSPSATAKAAPPPRIKTCHRLRKEAVRKLRHFCAEFFLNESDVIDELIMENLNKLRVQRINGCKPDDECETGEAA